MRGYAVHSSKSSGHCPQASDWSAIPDLMDRMTGTLTLNSHYPRVILRAIEDQPELGRQLLLEAGVAEAALQEPQARVPVPAQALLYQRISRHLNDESFGYLPNPLRAGTFAMACEYAASDTTIGRALQRLCHCYQLLTDDVRLSMELAGGQARFQVTLAQPELDSAYFITETMLCIGFRFPAWLAGQAIPLTGAAFAYPAPSHAAEYAFLFPGDHRFQAGENFVSFSADMLDLPIVKSMEDVRDYGERAPADLMNKLVGSDSFTNRVYLALSRRGDGERRDIGAIAGDLALTEQTLRRRLRTEGSSFQKIKDGLRLDTAIFHLSGSKYTIAEISEKLGFSTPGAFSRAFRNWMAMSPDEYRGR